MSILESNLEFLKSNYPELVRVVADYSNEDNYHVVFTKNEEPNLQMEHDGRILFLHSKYDAEAEACKWVSTLEEATDQLLVFGGGMGYFLEAVLKYSSSKHIIFYEPDILVFNYMLRNRDVRPLFSDARVKMVAVGDHEFVLAELAHNVTSKMSGEISVVASPIYQRMYKETLTKLRTQIKEAVYNEISNNQTYKMFNKQWIENILYNLPYTIKYPSFEVFKDTLKGTKVIIVGSGPSLKEDVHYLNNLKGKCFIIAAGSSVQALQHFDVEPDLVITMDGGEANYHVFEKIDKSRTPMLFITQNNYKILDHYSHNMAYAVFEDDQVSEYLLSNSKVPCFRSTASVTGTSLLVAAYMGAKEIILMGQDLSYTNNQFYSPGVQHVSDEVRKYLVNKSDDSVENVDGGINRTSKVMNIVRQNIEMNIKTLTPEGVQVINTSKGGAVIDATKWIAFEDLLPQLNAMPLNHFDISGMIRSSLPSEQKKQFDFDSTRNKLKFILKQLDEVEKKVVLLAKHINILDKNCKIRNVKKVNQGLIEVNNCWKWITDKESFTIFFTFGLSQYINTYMKSVPLIVETKDSINKAQLIVQNLGVLIDQMVRFSPELKDIIMGAIARIDSFSAKYDRGVSDG